MKKQINKKKKKKKKQGQAEFLYSSWQWVGPQQQMAVPSPTYFSQFATLSELPPSTLQKIYQFRDHLVFQKVLYRRGGKGEEGGKWWKEGGEVKRVLMKTHSSDCVELLGVRYPDARFVFGHRTPSKQLSSCFGFDFCFVLFYFVLFYFFLFCFYFVFCFCCCCYWNGCIVL